MLMIAIKMSRSHSNQIIYQLNVIPRDGKSRSAKCIKLKSFIGDGDQGETVITIMLPPED